MRLPCKVIHVGNDTVIEFTDGQKHALALPI